MILKGKIIQSLNCPFKEKQGMKETPKTIKEKHQSSKLMKPGLREVENDLI